MPYTFGQRKSAKTQATVDRTSRQRARRDFKRNKGVENRYARILKQVATAVSNLVNAHPTPLASAPEIVEALRAYAKALRPWAAAVGRRMVNEVGASSEKQWMATAREIGSGMRTLVETTETGVAAQQLVANQVDLITSLPREAAERVQRLAMENVIEGRRSDDIINEIMATGQVTKSRAALIARTEVGRATTAITEARAVSVGSKGYIWRTSKDGDVRPSHKAMEGKFVAWSDPPTLDGMTGHAGALPNCRCHPEVVIPEDI